MELALIVAMTDAGVIGKDNALPWRLPEDLARFKQLTMGHAILMGRKTFESIGRPLPGRKNIVLTRDPQFKKDGVVVAHDWEAALREAERPSGRLFVIGGAEIFKEALRRIELTRIYFTLIHASIDGDTFFPDMAWTTRFRVERQSDHIGEKADPLKYSFVDAVRFSN
jgi:dihydrofolate reductase